MTKRRKRIDSAAAAVEVMASAHKTIMPPAGVPLDADEVDFFSSIIAEAPKADWTDHQIDTAALLARAMAALVREQDALKAEGSIVAKGANGDPAENPRVGITAKLTSGILAMRRSLQLNTAAQKGDTRDTQKRRAMGRELEADLSDELLARPTIN